MNNENLSLPRWAYQVLTLACVVMGLWASFITLQYFEHGAKALESDPVLQALAVSAALMFVASEMGAFGLAALLTEAQLWARRWFLTGFAVCVLSLEVVTIVAVQLALTTGADITQASVLNNATGLQKQIDAVEKNVASFSATAESLRAADQLKKSAQYADKAAAEQAKTTALYTELAKVQTQKRPTLVGLLGHDNAIYYAVARGILVSLGGLVFFGTAGALLRAARGVSVPGAVAPVKTAMPDAPAAPASAPILTPASFKTTETIAPKDYATGLSYSSKMKLAGAGALAGTGALTAPITHAAPAVPAQAKAPATPLVAPANSASETVQPGASVSVQSGAPESARPGASETVQTGASVSVQSSASETVQPAVKKPRVKRAVSAKIDTGTDGKSGARYKRIKAGVMTGKIRPSIRGIQEIEGGSQDVVLDYLRQLEADGVTIRAGRGFTLAKKGGAK